jgi:hypothetical protein
MTKQKRYRVTRELRADRGEILDATDPDQRHSLEFIEAGEIVESTTDKEQNMRGQVKDIFGFAFFCDIHRVFLLPTSALELIPEELEQPKFKVGDRVRAVSDTKSATYPGIPCNAIPKGAIGTVYDSGKKDVDFATPYVEVTSPQTKAMCWPIADIEIVTEPKIEQAEVAKLQTYPIRTRFTPNVEGVFDGLKLGSGWIYEWGERSSVNNNTSLYLKAGCNYWYIKPQYLNVLPPETATELEVEVPAPVGVENKPYVNGVEFIFDNGDGDTLIVEWQQGSMCDSIANDRLYLFDRYRKYAFGWFSCKNLTLIEKPKSEMVGMNEKQTQPLDPERIADRAAALFVGGRYDGRLTPAIMDAILLSLEAQKQIDAMKENNQ